MKKRILSFLVCVSVIAAMISVSGCSSDTGKEGKKTTAPTAEKVTNVYKSEFAKIPVEYTPMSQTLSAADNRIYVLCSETIDPENYITQNVLYSVDMTGNNPQSEIISPSAENGYISNYKVTQDKSRLRIESAYDPDVMKSVYYLVKDNPDGTNVFSLDLSNSGIFSDEWYYVSGMAADSSGNIYISTNNNLAVLSPDGERKVNVQAEGNISSILPYEDTVLVTYYDQDRNTVYALLDSDTWKIDEPVQFPEMQSDYSRSILSGDGYDYYIKDSSGLFGFNSGDETVVKLADWLNSDIAQNRIGQLLILNPENLVYISSSGGGWTQSGDSSSDFVFLSRVPDDQVTEKYLVRLAVMSTPFSTLTSAVVDFNRTSDTYRVVIDDYSRYNSNDGLSYGGEGAQILSNEIAAGNIPDILIRDGMSQIAESLDQMEAFTDLYEFIDSDPDLGRDDFMPCVQRPFETNGKLYMLTTDFGLHVYAGKTSNLTEIMDNWTIETMLDFAESLPDGKTFLSSVSDGTNMSKSALLTIFVMAGFDRFVSWDTRECSFDSDLFRRILAYVNSVSESAESQSQDRYEAHKNDQVMLDGFYIYSYADYIDIIQAFGTEEITLLGLPGADEGKAVIYPMQSFSISSKSDSEIQKGAWQFLKKLVTGMDQYVSMIPVNGHFSAYRGFNETLADVLVRNIAFRLRPDGTKSIVSFSDAVTDREQYYGLQPDGSNVVPVKQEYADIMADYMDNIKSSYVQERDEQIYSFIIEECEAFFAGAKTMEETVKIIQSRVSVYINESK